MIAVILGVATLLTWITLLATGFWTVRERDTNVPVQVPPAWPSVVAVVPARNEADVVGRVIASLCAQDYPGAFRIVLVDDGSADRTAAIARQAGGERVMVIPGTSLPGGWTGKLWAVSQGIASTDHPDYLWLTDADIEHAPDTLRTLVGIAGRDDRVLVSFMAKLRCDALAERVLIPAFVFFLQMLYPFARVNRATGSGAGAGGCMLVRRDALVAAGGIEAIRGALIDDCALGAALKRQGRIWLGLTERSCSIRPYDDWPSVAAMIARSAYAQLRYSPVLLFGAVTGLSLVFVAPPLLAVLADGAVRWLGLAAWALMATSFQPMLRFYRRSPWWGAALPAIACFYLACTLASAWQHRRGRGGLWKGRVQATASR